MMLIFGMLAGVYFFAKGDEPAEDEAKLYGFRSSKDELKTYGAAVKGMALFLAVLGIVFVGVWVLLKMIRTYLKKNEVVF